MCTSAFKILCLMVGMIQYYNLNSNIWDIL